MLSTQDLGEHRWRRKTWERGFGSLQLREYEPRVLHHLDVFTSQMNARLNSKSLLSAFALSYLIILAPVNMTHWCEFFAYDVMSDLAFSEDFGMLSEGKPHPYVRALHGGTRVLTIAAQTPWIRPLMPYMPIDKQSKIAGKEFGKISRATYDRRRARQIKQKDMFEYLAIKSDTPRPLTEAEFIADTSRESEHL
jgi:cytochrome P450